MTNKQVAIFQGQKIRRIWDEKTEQWFFSVVDIIQILTGSTIPRRYWSDLKNKLKLEGSEVYEKIVQLKMIAGDGKIRETDVADTEVIFRIVQSIPSKKAEPLKRWLARVGYERVQEIQDPEKALDRSRKYWQRMGRSQKWIQQRMMGQEVRNKLTDYWADHEVKKQDEYAILTNIIHSEWSDLSVQEHKQLKNLKTENLRDHMTDAELIFTALAELSTRQIAENLESVGFEENKIPAKKGGKIAKDARIQLEQKSGKKIVSGENFRLSAGKNRKS